MTRIESMTPQEAYMFLFELTGADPMQGVAVAELVRNVVSSHSRCRYQRLLHEVINLIAPVREVTPEHARVVIDALEADGDILVSRGAVGVTPIRAVQLDEQTFKFMSSLPTRRLGGLFPGDWICHEATRLCRPAEPSRMRRLIAAHGGVLLSAAAWAGLNHEPPADEAWLAAIEQRLADHPNQPESHVFDHRLDWQWLDYGETALTWQKAEAAEGRRLWRGINFRGYWIYAMTRAGSPATQPWLPLTRNEMYRTIFALARVRAEGAGHAIPTAISHQVDGTVIALPPLLPYAEYRYLTVLARSRQSRPATVRWKFSQARLPQVLEILEQRLGLRLSGGIPPGAVAPAAVTSANQAPSVAGEVSPLEY
jgi:hypothetical protein